MNPLRQHRFQKRGNAVAMVAVCGTVLVGFAALSIDMSVLYRVRSEAQRSADAGALAGAWKLVTNDRLIEANIPTVLDGARQMSSSMAGNNLVYDGQPQVSQTDDILLGRLNNPSNRTEQLNTAVTPAMVNSVSVLVRRDQDRNGAVPLYFAQLFGFYQKNVSARAVATAENNIVGFRAGTRTGKAELLPFAVHLDAWNNLLSRVSTAGDNYSYNPVDQTVSAGSDGIYELNMYPGSGGTQLPPGNFGTVDIGNPNNSTSDISRQIREGVNAEDLAYFGGELKLGADGTLILEGDTGLSAGIKDDLASIIGLPRAIPLFISVTGNGNNSRFTVVGFAGIRILRVKLTGSMSSKAVIIQPAVVVTDAAISTESSTYAFGVFRPPALVR